MHRQSILIGEVGIYKNAIHMGVCANTYMCTDTHVYTCAALLHLRQQKAAKISPSTENRWEASQREARLGGGVRTSLLVQYSVDCIAHGDHYLTYPIGN